MPEYPDIREIDEIDSKYENLFIEIESKWEEMRISNDVKESTNAKKKKFFRVNALHVLWSLWFGSFCIFLTLKWTSSLSTKFFWTQKTVGLVLKSNMSYTVSICVETFKSSTRRKFSSVFAGSSDHHTYPYFIYFQFYKFLVLPVSSFPWNSINSRYFL